jgi:hypothetical protein
MSTTWIVVLVIIVFIIIFVVGFLIYEFLERRPNQENLPNFIPLGLDNPCQTITDCPVGLQCDLTNGLCKLGLDAKCQTNDECVNPYICDRGEQVCTIAS